MSPNIIEHNVPTHTLCDIIDNCKNSPGKISQLVYCLQWPHRLNLEIGGELNHAIAIATIATMENNPPGKRGRNYSTYWEAQNIIKNNGKVSHIKSTKFDYNNLLIDQTFFLYNREVDPLIDKINQWCKKYPAQATSVGLYHNGDLVGRKLGDLLSLAECTNGFSWEGNNFPKPL